MICLCNKKIIIKIYEIVLDIVRQVIYNQWYKSDETHRTIKASKRVIKPIYKGVQKIAFIH